MSIVIHILYSYQFNAYSHTAVDCGDLPNPDNGQVTLTSTTFGSTANYTCDPGFELVGIAMRTCMANGEWSGEAPTCSRE